MLSPELLVRFYSPWRLSRSTCVLHVTALEKCQFHSREEGEDTLPGSQGTHSDPESIPEKTQVQA